MPPLPPPPPLPTPVSVRGHLFIQFKTATFSIPVVEHWLEREIAQQAYSLNPVIFAGPLTGLELTPTTNQYRLREK